MYRFASVLLTLVLVALFVTPSASAQEYWQGPTELERYGGWSHPLLGTTYMPDGSVRFNLRVRSEYLVDEVVSSFVFEDGSYALTEDEFEKWVENHSLSFTPATEGDRFERAVHLGNVNDPGFVRVHALYTADGANGSYAFMTFDLDLASYDISVQVCTEEGNKGRGRNEVVVSFQFVSMRAVADLAQSIELWDGRELVLGIYGADIETYGHHGTLELPLKRREYEKTLAERKLEVSVNLEGEWVTRYIVFPHLANVLPWCGKG